MKATKMLRATLLTIFWAALVTGASASRMLKQDECPVLEGYDFIQGGDSWETDVGEQVSGDPAQIAAFCGETEGCIGFNTNGWLKTSFRDPLDPWDNAAACDGLYVAATPYVCIRPLAIMDWMDEAAPAVHCYIQAGTWSTAFDKYGLHAEVDTEDDTKECYPVEGAVLPALQTAASRAAGSGQYDAEDYSILSWNCCHYIDTILQEAGSQAVTSYFEGWHLPEPTAPEGK